MLKDWNWGTAHDGYTETRREQARLQEEKFMKEKVLRDAQIRNVHELGDMKRAQELRKDELSYNTKAHFAIAGNVRADEFYE